MADYKELLRRAIEALAENNGAGRRQVYEKARGALVLQLRAIEPPLPAREITQHRLKLEDCIRQVEQEATEALLQPSPRPAPVAAPPDSAAEERAEEAIARALVVDDAPEPVPETRQKPKPAQKGAAGKPAPEKQPSPKPIVENQQLAGMISTRKKAVPPEPDMDEDEEEMPAPAPKRGKSRPAEPKPAEPKPATLAAKGRKQEIVDAPEDSDEADFEEEAEDEHDPEDDDTGGKLSIEAVIAAAQRDAEQAPAKPAARPVVKPARRIEEPPRRRGLPLDGDARGDAAKRGPQTDRQMALESSISAAMSSVREVEVENGHAMPRGGAEPADDNPQAAIDRAIAALDREVNGAAVDAPVSRPAMKTPAPEAAPNAPNAPEVLDEPSGRANADDDFWSEADEAAFEAGNEEFEHAPRLHDEPTGRGGFTIFLALVAVLLLVAGGGGYWAWREGFVDLGGLLARVGIGGPPAAPTNEPVDTGEVAPSPAEQLPANTEASPAPQLPSDTALPTNGAGAADLDKIDDRLAADTEVRVVEPETPANVDAVAPAAPANAADAAGTQAPVVDPPIREALVDPALTEGNQSILLEEQGAGTAGPAPFSGSVEWSRDVDELGLPVIRGRANIPARNLTVDMLIRKNSDEALPASHLMEINFEVLDSFVGGGIASLPGVLLKNEELAQGRPLVGASARVFDNSFLFALSAEPVDVAANSALLRDQAWVDLPMVYSTGRRAIITLEKGADGQEIFTSVLAAWAQD